MPMHAQYHLRGFCSTACHKYPRVLARNDRSPSGVCAAEGIVNATDEMLAGVVAAS